MRQSVRAIVVKYDSLLVMKRNKYGHQFYVLAGGGIDAGENPEQALRRELIEEASIEIADNPKLVAVCEHGEQFGNQYVYLCYYLGGEPRLSPDSEEASANTLGENTYEPMWVAIEDLPNTNLLPTELRDAVYKGLKDGFPPDPILINIPDPE